MCTLKITKKKNVSKQRAERERERERAIYAQHFLTLVVNMFAELEILSSFRRCTHHLHLHLHPLHLYLHRHIIISSAAEASSDPQ